MKKIIISLLLAFTIQGASAQEIFKEVKRMLDENVAYADNTENNLEKRKIATFKADAIYYLMSRGSKDSTFTEYDLGLQTAAMIDFVNIFVKRVADVKKKERETIQAKFKGITLRNPLFNDPEKNIVYGYVDNDSFITQFSIDTDWVKALEELKK